MITIYGSFPGLNEFIDANRTGRGKWQKGNDMKQRDQKAIMLQLPRIRLSGPIFIKCIFYCKDRRKDPDNISGYFHKILLDAMVERGMIPDDGWKHVKGFRDDFKIDRRMPRVEVEIEEIS